MAKVPMVPDPDDEDHDAGGERTVGGLAALLIEIAEVAGLDAALTLADRYGGDRIYIPRKAGDEHWLTLCVGRQAADKICKHFATPSGIELELPRGPTNRSLRRARMRRYITAGLTSGEITRRMGVTRRTVTRARAAFAANREPEQLDMFPPEPVALDAPSQPLSLTHNTQGTRHER